MERTVSLQLAGKRMVTAWQPKSSCRRQDNKTFESELGSSEVSYCGRKNGQLRLGLPVSQYSCRTREPQIRTWQSVPRSRSQRRAKRMSSSVLNEVGQSSSQVPSGAASPDELKDQLEALQDEALQVRTRYNNARARFMRLTEVAQQLRQRASIDLNHGNEDGARKALVEKQKVIQAAEISKRRAQLLEELSTKLGEAVSVKETQLIVALASPQREEPTVRVVSTTVEGSNIVDPSSEKEVNPTSVSAAEPSQVDHEGLELKNSLAEAENSPADRRQLVLDDGDAFVEEETASLAAELGYSRDRYLYSNEEDAGETTTKPDSSNVNLPFGGGEWMRDDRDIYALSGEGLSLEDSLQGESLTLGVEESASLNGTEDVDSAGKDTSLHEMEGREQNDGRECSRENGFHRGLSRSVEGLIAEVDEKVARVELQLQTAVIGDTETSDVELQLVRDLLERVQSLRARISEVAGSLMQQETQ